MKTSRRILQTKFQTLPQHRTSPKKFLQRLPLQTQVQWGEEGQNRLAFPSILSEQAQVEAADNFSVEVAGDNTATDEVSGEITFSEVSGLQNAGNSLETVKQEEDQQTLGLASTEAVIEAAHQTESTPTTNLGEDAIVAAVVKAEVDPKSPEADTSEVAASVDPKEHPNQPVHPLNLRSLTQPLSRQITQV